MIGEQQNLPVTIAAAFPAALTRVQVEAAEDAVGEAVSAAIVNNIVVERRLNRARLPLSLGSPLAVRERDFHKLHAVLGLCQEFAIRDRLRLSDRQKHPFAGPLPR